MGLITEQSVEVGGWKWFYREAKPTTQTNKTPVVFLHGIPSQSYSWCEMMPKVAERGMRAIAPDWIGHGFSDKPEKQDFPYTPEAYRDALGEFLDALELERVCLVVQGFLGSVGIQYALKNRDRVERLVILNAPLSPTVKLPWKMKQWAIPLVGEMVVQDPLIVDRTLEGGSGFLISDANLDVYRKPFLQASAAGRALKATTQKLDLPKVTAELEAQLPTWEKPLQIIWGCADPWLEITPVETLAQANRQIELVKLPEAKHYPQEHWSEEIGKILVDFLRRQTPS